MEDQTRIDILTVIEQIIVDHTAYPLAVDTDNLRTIDQVKQTDPYLRVDIDYLPGGGQLDMADRPMVKQVGQLVLYAVVKENTGTAEAGRLLEFVQPYFELKTHGGVTFHAAQRAKGVVIKGWLHVPLWSDFWSTRLAG